MGIEPTLVAWEATVLPLNYTRWPPGFYAGSVSPANLPCQSAGRVAVAQALHTFYEINDDFPDTDVSMMIGGATKMLEQVLAAPKD
jgi:hypothetical protein